MRWLPLLLVLSACAAPRQEGPTRAQEELAQELSGRVAGQPETCISATTSSALTIVDSRTLTYRQGGTIWVNRLEAECPGLSPMDVLVVEVQGSQYCRRDRVRAIQPGSSVSGPLCLLGHFTPYSRP